MYKKIISIEEQLHKISNDNPEYAELWSTWNLNKKTLEPILNAIIKDYPHYSFHDHTHSESILLNIEKSLGNKNIENLSPTDLWLLLHVSYLHDFGMVILESQIHDFWTSQDFQEFLEEQHNGNDEDFKNAADIVLFDSKNEKHFQKDWPLEVKSAVTLLISKYCRWQHGSFSKNYLLDINNIWGIDIGHNGLVKKRFVSLIAEISAMHTKPFDDIYKLHKIANGFKGDYVHPRLIASLLRLGDVLDLDNGRFNPYGEKIFGKMPNDSKVHYEKHEATKHVLISNDLIEVEADCPNDAVYRETRRWYDSLKNEIELMHLNWREIATEEFGYPPKLAPYKILRNGIEDLNELSNLKFGISQNKAFEILEGSSIYEDKFSCIREIVQNAEDAIKIQMWRDIVSGMYYCTNGIDKTMVDEGTLMPCDIPEWIYQIYSISISVERNIDNNAVISVTDHGTGISLDSLKAICNVGQSYFQQKERKKEIESMPVWLRPTANFGIGLQSCFMATDKIIIYTNSNENGSYKMTFKSGKQEGYVNVEPIKEKIARGSSVEIEIQNDLNFSFKILGYTAEKLSKIEPFETNCIVIYKIIEAIFEECDSSFFEISVNSESADFSENIPAKISENGDFPREQSEQGYYYLLSNKYDKIDFWYKNNLYTIVIQKYQRGTINVNFKGKQVKKHKINQQQFACFSIDIDLYDYTAKEALSLNREELTEDIVLEIYENIYYLIGEFLKLLTQKKKNIEELTKKEQGNIVDVLLITAPFYKQCFPEYFSEMVSKDEDIRIIRYNEETKEYEVDNCSLYDIKNEFYKIPYIEEDITMNPFTKEELTEEKAVNLLNHFLEEKEKYKLIIIDNKIKNIFSKMKHNKFYLKIDNGKNLNICVTHLEDNLYKPDKYTRACLIKKLVHENESNALGVSIMRKAIPAFDEFAKLAVEIKNIFIRGGEFSRWKIISPITFNDNKKINEYSKEHFIEYIVNQKLFSNLVQYVKENGKYPKQDEKVIIEEYKKLIGEYYDLVKK